MIRDILRKMIKAIIFDFGGVVVADIYMPWVSARLSDLSEEMRRQFLQAEDLANRGRMAKEQFFRIFDDTFGAGSLEKLNSQVPQVHVRFDQDIIQLIGELRRKYKIGLLSNNFSFWASQARGLDYMKNFDVVVFSSDVGVAKPEGDIYVLMAEKLGVAINECLFIDNLQVNVEGAEKMGMKGVLYKGAGEIRRELLRRGLM